MTSSIVPLGLEREVKQTHRAIIMLSAVPGSLGRQLEEREGGGEGGAESEPWAAGNQPERRWKGFGGK